MLDMNLHCLQFHHCPYPHRRHFRCRHHQCQPDHCWKQPGSYRMHHRFRHNHHLSGQGCTHECNYQNCLTHHLHPCRCRRYLPPRHGPGQPGQDCTRLGSCRFHLLHRHNPYLHTHPRLRHDRCLVGVYLICMDSYQYYPGCGRCHRHCHMHLLNRLHRCLPVMCWECQGSCHVSC